MVNSLSCSCLSRCVVVDVWRRMSMGADADISIVIGGVMWQKAPGQIFLRDPKRCSCGG